MRGLGLSVFNAHPRRRFPRDATKQLVRTVLRGEGARANELNVVFVDDKRTLQLNRRFLAHDHPTDVISFRLDEDDRISGEVYVNLDQAVRQAKEYGVSTAAEVSRLVIHGVLHLIGYRDDTTSKRRRMHAQEDFYLKKGIRWRNRSSLLNPHRRRRRSANILGKSSRSKQPSAI